MKALVTGGNGFIGSHLVEHLLKKGHSVRCLIRKTSNKRWLEGLDIEFVYGDLFDADALRTAVSGVDYVYHSAGLTKARKKEEYYRVNRDGTKNILHATLEHAGQLRRFIQISSQAAVGPSPSRTPINEQMTPHPITTYGRSKWEAEQECHSMNDRLPITIARPPAVYGPRDTDVFEFFRTMSRGLQPMIGFRDKFVSLIHAKDLVRGFVLAGENSASQGKTYFISSKDVYSWKQLGEVTRKIIGKNPLRIRVPESAVFIVSVFAEFFSRFSSKPALLNVEKGRDIVQEYWTCDSSRAKHDFGYEEEISIENGIQETVDWYRSIGWLQ